MAEFCLTINKRGEGNMNTGISLDFFEHPVLYYDSVHNLFVDDGGYIVFDIFRIITPNILWLFREKKQDMDITPKPEQIGVITKSHEAIKLIYSYGEVINIHGEVV
jgi:hypothetical protein